MAIIAQLARRSLVLSGTAPASGNAYFSLASGTPPTGWSISTWFVAMPAGARVRVAMTIQGVGQAQILPTAGTSVTSAQRDYPTEQIVFTTNGESMRFRTPNTAEGTPFMVEVAIL